MLKKLFKAHGHVADEAEDGLVAIAKVSEGRLRMRWRERD
jgi:hypothetical protein